MWVEQSWEGWRDASVGRTSWEGGKRKLEASRHSIPSAPPLSHDMTILAVAREPQRGRAWGQCRQASWFPLATLPSLFDPLRRPATPSELDRNTETSLVHTLSTKD